MIIIGAGRIGTALKARSERIDVPVVLVDRTSGSEALEGAQGAPILVAVRNDALVDVVARVPAHRRSDLVFIQNGMFRSLLREVSLVNATRGLLYFAVAKLGDEPIEGLTSPFCGPHGPAMATWLGRMGLRAESMDWARFTYYELEKLMWLSCFGILCATHDCTVGEVIAKYRNELAALVVEQAAIGRAGNGVDAPADYMLARLVAYSESIASFRAGVKEWPYRDGWLCRTAMERGVSAPVYFEHLRSLGYEPTA